MSLTDAETYALMKRFREHPDSFTPEQRAEWGKLNKALEAWSVEMTENVRFDADAKLLKIERGIYDAAKARYDKTVADLAEQEHDLPQDDMVGRAEIQLERAKAAAAFKKIELHWQSIAGQFDESEERYNAAVETAKRHPILSHEP